MANAFAFSLNADFSLELLLAEVGSNCPLSFLSTIECLGLCLNEDVYSLFASFIRQGLYFHQFGLTKGLPYGKKLI